MRRIRITLTLASTVAVFAIGSGISHLLTGALR